MKLQLGAHTFEQVENFNSIEEAVETIKQLLPDVEEKLIREKVKPFINVHKSKDIQEEDSESQETTGKNSKKRASEQSSGKD
ncbi:hypothetical protein [Elizabethkingia anophelis]|uniref:hypothetical protein n=1 Tax=Elizabethkingia anophelis TaxID=1117645 RepID=UPI003208E6ED